MLCLCVLFNLQLKAVVEELHSRSGSKWPLVILHKKRLKSFREDPCSRRLLEEWIDDGVLYTTPHGSNDDWYPHLSQALIVENCNFSST